MKKSHPIEQYVRLVRTDPAAAAKLCEEHKDDKVFMAAVRFREMLVSGMREAPKKPVPPFEQHKLFPAIEAPPPAAKPACADADDL